MIEYAKGLALSALGRVPEAEAQHAVFLEAKAKVPDSRLLHNVRVVDLLEIAQAMPELAQDKQLYKGYKKACKKSYKEPMTY